MKKKIVFLGILCACVICFAVSVNAIHNLHGKDFGFSEEAMTQDESRAADFFVNGEQLTYVSTATDDVAQKLNCVNRDSLMQKSDLYQDAQNNLYRINDRGEIASIKYDRGMIYSESSVPEETAIAHVIETLRKCGIAVTKEEIISCGLCEWGGYQIAFQMGNAAEISDLVIAAVNGDGSPINFVIQRRGIARLEDVDTAFFERQLQEYLKLDPEKQERELKSSVIYSRVGDSIVATYTLEFSSEASGAWVETVSFAK